MTFRNLLAAIAFLGVIGGATVPHDALANNREDAIKAADADGNNRLDGKEMKTLKKGHPRMYENLMSFCEKAKEHPKKNGVELPADPDKKQTQCKKKHVAKPYLKAWKEQIEDGPVDGGKPEGPGRAGDGGRREDTGH